MIGHRSASRLSQCVSSRYLGSRSCRRYFQSSPTQSSEQTLPLYPSVAQLIHENQIPDSEIPKIPATGPNGRLLKGDVLSYIGTIPSDYPSSLSSRLSKLTHLDLSNIKPAASPAPAPAPAPAKEREEVAPTADALPLPVEDIESRLALPISLSRVLRVQKRVRSAIGVNIPLATFVERATEIANDELPVTRCRTGREMADQIFDEIVGIRRSSTNEPPPTSRGDYFPDIISASDLNSAPESLLEPEADIIDILSGKVSTKNIVRRQQGEKISAAEGDGETSVFSITVPNEEKLRGQAFLARMQVVLEDEPEKLVML
ncbi:pyridoxine biosynthesis protein [Ophidiomyces ophidiicola]|nr:pyridoxine biosynthesis protein [Ophidiomyces ophidiicola]KAI1992164.1 pyridoxine biosynthesis protein [Ophidiomyces ophidiicola]KAI1994192.1 pyridoxine biosynthesis protein [Ophidiomyces ophidiicola]KAI2003048.1 pyridoxine biosynthesis protein [Ophidiomyces ophidiicola]